MTRDIDLIIARIRAELPEVEVVQMHQTHPADDDGLWWFRLPGKKKDIQIESSTYSLPFIVEHSDMRSSDEAHIGHTIDEVVRYVTSYLMSLR